MRLQICLALLFSDDCKVIRQLAKYNDSNFSVELRELLFEKTGPHGTKKVRHHYWSKPGRGKKRTKALRQVCFKLPTATLHVVRRQAKKEKLYFSSFVRHAVRETLGAL